jgi:hypothetical protein
MDGSRQTQSLLTAYAEASNRLAKELQKQWEDSLEAVHRAASVVVESMTSDQTRWAEFARTAQAATWMPFADASAARVQLQELSNAVQRAIAPALVDLQRLFRDLPPRLQRALLTLGAHGWYLDPEMSMPDLWELQEALEQGDVDQAESQLCEYFEHRLDTMEASINERMPDRAHLFRSAFQAHQHGEYALSIPVFLAQTDGICKDMVGHYLFRKGKGKRRGKQATAEYVEQFAADSLQAALLSPLGNTLPINASENELTGAPGVLNRHEVLHGRSLDYGTKKNSLKAISLVNYVSSVLRRPSEGKPNGC